MAMMAIKILLILSDSFHDVQYLCTNGTIACNAGENMFSNPSTSFSFLVWKSRNSTEYFWIIRQTHVLFHLPKTNQFGHLNLLWGIYSEFGNAMSFVSFGSFVPLSGGNTGLICAGQTIKDNLCESGQEKNVFEHAVIMVYMQ